MVAKQVFDHSLRESGKRFSSSLKASNRYSAAELEYSGVHDLASIDQSVLNHLAASDTLAAQRLRMLLDYATADDPENPGREGQLAHTVLCLVQVPRHQPPDDRGRKRKVQGGGPTSLPHIQ